MATKRPADDQGSGSGEPPVKKHATLQPVNIGTVGNLVNNNVNNNRALLLGGRHVRMVVGFITTYG